jgi:Uma2 family endonuclease
MLAAALMGPFDQGRNGPGGWLFLNKPELHFGNDVLVPDIAAWRRTRLPALAPEPYLTLAPDWVCEVLSPSTEKLDRGEKLRVYAREHVAYVWLIDPSRQALEVLALDQRERWTKRGALEGRANVRVAPFDAIEVELGALWI